MFPAEQMGPAVVKAWLAVLPAGTILAPVGGITPDNMQVFIDAGVKGFGLGSGLFKPGMTVGKWRPMPRPTSPPGKPFAETLALRALHLNKRDKKMKITKLTTFIVPPRWCFLKVETDEGVTGWGEPVVEGRAHTVAAAVEELSDYLIGKDPRNIEDIWTVLYRGGFYRGGAIHMSALAGIDQALWDIKGKALGCVGQRSAGRPGARQDSCVFVDRRRPSGRHRACRERGGGPWFHRGENERHRRAAVPRHLRESRPGPGQRRRRARCGGPERRHRRRLPWPGAQAHGQGADERARPVQTDVHRRAGAQRKL
jgi:hypothetical protein